MDRILCLSCVAHTDSVIFCRSRASDSQDRQSQAGEKSGQTPVQVDICNQYTYTHTTHTHTYSLVPHNHRQKHSQTDRPCPPLPLLLEDRKSGGRGSHRQESHWETAITPALALMSLAHDLIGKESQERETGGQGMRGRRGSAGNQ